MKKLFSLFLLVGLVPALLLSGCSVRVIPIDSIELKAPEEGVGGLISEVEYRPTARDFPVCRAPELEDDLANVVHLADVDGEALHLIGTVRRRGDIDLNNYDIGEWIAEDFRLIIDPNSPYPHKFAYITDLLDPKSGEERRRVLKEALGI